MSTTPGPRSTRQRLSSPGTETWPPARCREKEKDRSKTGPMPSFILAPDVYSAAANSFSPSAAA